MTPEEKALRDLKRVGLALLLAGALASSVLEAIAREKARVRETRRRARSMTLRIRVDTISAVAPHKELQWTPTS